MKLLPKLQHAFGFAPLLALAMAAPALTTQAAVLYPENDGFELPNLGGFTSSYVYSFYPDFTPSTGKAWDFVGDAGISANQSAFYNTNTQNGNFGSPYQSDVGQAGFLQNGNGLSTGSGASSFSQTVSGFELGAASITFSLQAYKYDTGSSVSVYLDSLLVGTYSALSTETFNTVTTDFVSVTAGSHVLSFVGNTGNSVTYIDSVSINAVPEPGTYALLLVAGAVLFIAVRNKRRNQDGSLEVSRS